MWLGRVRRNVQRLTKENVMRVFAFRIMSVKIGKYN